MLDTGKIKFDAKNVFVIFKNQGPYSQHFFFLVPWDWAE